DDCLTLAQKSGHTIRAEICQADISNPGDRSNLISFAKSEFRRLDLLVNNAGVAPDIRADILDATEESFDRLISINVKGPYFLSQLAAKWMIEQTNANSTKRQNHPSGTQPKIITISSVSAYTASVN